MPEFSAIMFDMDGVLADTEPLKGLAHVMAIATLGYVAHLDQYAEVMGQPSEQVRLHLLNSVGAEAVDPEYYQSLFRRYYTALINTQLKPMPGAIELVEMLARAFRIAVVSSSDRHAIDITLDRLQIIQLIDVIVSSEDVSQEKPSPEPYVLAAVRLRTRNCRSVVFEDTEAGIQSAIGAGSRVIAVRHKFNRHHDFSDADLEVDNLLQWEQIKQFLEDSSPKGS
ncbi:MAG: HAD family phosphatase [Streptosporangiaceae bacterium]